MVTETMKSGAEVCFFVVVVDDTPRLGKRNWNTVFTWCCMLGWELREFGQELGFKAKKGRLVETEEFDLREPANLL